MEYRLPQGRNLLEHLDLEGGRPRTSTRPKPVEGVVLGDGGGEAAIENHRCRLPYHLHEAYFAVPPPPSVPGRMPARPHPLRELCPGMSDVLTPPPSSTFLAAVPASHTSSFPRSLSPSPLAPTSLPLPPPPPLLLLPNDPVYTPGGAWRTYGRGPPTGSPVVSTPPTQPPPI